MTQDVPHVVSSVEFVFLLQVSFQYNPPPLAPWPASPSGDDFDFTEADTIPLSVPPAAGNLLPPVKDAWAVGGN